MKSFFSNLNAWIYKFILDLELLFYKAFLKEDVRTVLYIKASLSYIIRDIYDKNVIGENHRIDSFINIVINDLLGIQKPPENLSNSERIELDHIKTDVENDDRFNYIYSLYFQTKGISFYYNSLLGIRTERDKNRQLYDSFLETCTQQKVPLLFNPKRPNFWKIKKKAQESLKINEMIVMVKNLNNDISSLKFLFNNLSNLLTLVITFTIIFSSLYEIGYFYGLKIDIHSIYIGYSDLVLLALKWAPKIIIVILVIIIMELFKVKSNNIYSIVQQETDFFKYFYYFLIAAILFLPAKEKYIYFFSILLSSIIWIKTIHFFFFKPSIVVRRPYFLKSLVTYMPLIFIVFLIMGYAQASMELTSTSNLRTIKLINGERLVDVHVLRNFTSGVLYADSKKIFFLPTSQISKTLISE
ncbi:hypothetical protein SCO38_01895 [Legionella pneumophila serogroup 1]